MEAQILYVPLLALSLDPGREGIKKKTRLFALTIQNHMIQWGE